jgi:hypothetical protein
MQGPRPILQPTKQKVQTRKVVRHCFTLCIIISRIRRITQVDALIESLGRLVIDIDICGARDVIGAVLHELGPRISSEEGTVNVGAAGITTRS